MRVLPLRALWEKLQRAEVSAFARVAAVLAVVLTVFGPTAWSMVEMWQRSGTYAHGFVVLPVFLGWVWVRRSALSHLPVRPFWPGLAGLAGLGALWLVSGWMAAQAPSQFAVVAMLPVAVATVLGLAWVQALALPFAFLFFAVPAGDALIPHMIDWTADFTVAALRLSGVPVYREDTHFWIPSGQWSVVEACSGVRYLMACAAVGTVYAAVTYRSSRRRLAFVAFAVLCAVVANWVRAYGIVLTAHLTDNRIATGVDHLIYGWVFFGVIVGLMFFVGSRWREDVPLAPRHAAASAAPVLSGQNTAVALAAAAAVVVLGVWPVASRIGAPGDVAPVAALTIAPARGWTAVQAQVSSWRPELRNPASELAQTFEKDGMRVAVYLGLYRAQAKDAKLWSSVNQLVSTTNRHWMMVGRGSVRVPSGTGTVDVNTATLASREARIVAWQWYWTSGAVTASRWRAALEEALARLQGRHATSAWVTLHALEAQGAGASRALETFMHDMAGSLEEGLRAQARLD